MMKLSYTVPCLLAVFSLNSVHAYSDRSGICVDDPSAMAGGMGGSNNMQLGWSLQVDTNSYTPGNQVKVTVSPTNPDDNFKGLLLFARATNNAHLGTWNVIEGTQTLDSMCKAWGLDKSTLSHDGKKTFSGSVTFTWNAPKIGLGPVEFRGLLVTDGKANWMQFPPRLVNGPGSVDAAKNISAPAGKNAAVTISAPSFLTATLAGIAAFLF